MKRVVGCLLLLALTIVAPALVEAAPERRVALVIGNGHYDAVPRLANPGPDAGYVAAALRQSGFEVVTLEIDLPREKLVEALRTFASEAGRSDWAVIYYAGHGMEVNGMNYLIPVDARLTTDRDLQFEGVPMSQALGAVEGARKMRLLILDACRDNPFAIGMKRNLATRSIGRGLAQIEPEGGTLVAYAAKHGQLARDGRGEHSPYVTALVKHMRTPGLEIYRLFRRIRSDVMSATDDQQEPFIYGSLPDEDFYFAPPGQQPAGMKSEQGVESVKTPEADKTASDPAAKPEPGSGNTLQDLSKDGAAALPSPVPSFVPRPEPGKKLATTAPPSVPAIEPRPVPTYGAPRPVLRPRPSARRRPPAPPQAEKPEPVVVRPKRIVQRVERPTPAATRPRPAASSGGGGHCFMFNGERVCE